MSNGTSTVDRHAPGSAFHSQATSACLTGALVIFIAVVQLVLGGHTEELFYRTSGYIVTAIWSLCVLSLALVSIWAAGVKRDPSTTLADLMPQRVLGWTIFLIALLSSLLLGI